MHFHLNDLALFARVAALGSLSAAALEHDMPVSQVSRALARLEAACGVRLMHRNTHGLSLTGEGDTLLVHGAQLLNTAESLSADLRGKQSAPSGWVRLSVSASVAHAVIAPGLAGLYARYPRLQVDVVVDDRLSDMARDGIDIALRTGSVQSETLVARQIGVASRSLYASPHYLAAHGTPLHPDDLAQHHVIASSNAPAMNQWQRVDATSTATSTGTPGAPSVVRIKGQTLTNDSALLLRLVEQGVGMGRLLDVVAHAQVQAGQLVPLLQGFFDVEAIPLYAVMLQERHRLPKIRACVDYWQAWLQGMQRS